MQKPSASVAVVGAGDYIGAAVARRFAREGYHVFAGRRNGDKLAPLAAEIEAAGGTCTGLSLDARQEDAVADFIRQADEAAPLELAVFNIGANVNVPLLDTTGRVFRKVWELACYAGFLTGREAARRMLPRGRGSIFSPAPLPASAAAAATRRSPEPNSGCARWLRAWLGNSVRRTSMSPIW
jgi:NAD(P)-dependent dehydrogenase (short-subunit alcohol dehydrogenase family)